MAACGNLPPMSDNRLKSETRNVPALSLRAAFQPSTVNDEARTVEVQWTTGAAVLRSSFWDGDFYEELSLDPKSVRMDRLSSGRAPFLANHDSRSLDSVIGVVEAASIGSARVRFVKGDPAADAAWNKVKQGVLPNVSVGYRVHKMEKVSGGEGETPTFRVTDWTPHEISLVPMGADAAAYVRSDTDKNQCVFVTQESRTMSDKKTTPEQIPAPVPAQTPDLDAVRAEAVKAERSRADEINKLTRALGADAPAFASKLLADGSSVEQARAAILAEVVKRADATPTASQNRAEITDDNRDKFLRGVSAWLCEKSGNGLVEQAKTMAQKNDARELKQFKNVETDGAEFRGMKIVDIARLCCERNGVSLAGVWSYEEIIKRALSQRSGYAAASDFATLFETAMHKQMRAAYAVQEHTWRRWCGTDVVSDFRNSNRYLNGSFSTLPVVGENEEYTNLSVPDGAKVLIQTRTRGAIIALGRQAMVNDDMGALSDVAVRFGATAGRSIDVEAYALLQLHSGLGPYWDGTQITGSTPFFDDTAYANVASHTVLGVAGLDADRVKMRKQQDISSNDYLDITPSILLVPVGLESAAKIINSAQYDFDGSALMKPNAVQGMFTDIVSSPRLTDSSRRWLFTSNKEAFKAVFLEGSGEGPFMESQMGFRTDGLEWKARIDVKVCPFDAKAAVTNAGTA